MTPYVRLFGERQVPEDRGTVAFVAPPWGTAWMKRKAWTFALSLLQSAVVDRIARQFAKHNILFAVQIYAKVRTPSLTQIQRQFDWTALHTFDINEKRRNHGILLGTKGWAGKV
ncbi:MAG TPA: hypothetical protein VMQ17_02745 [Candidatus Sulfotelmatobacter sp.]|nr:hypothetical protein [Candidatus Sulfotelmatobacter sp.]